MTNKIFPGSEEIADQIYVYKKFIPDDMLIEYSNLINSMTEDQWVDGEKFNKPGNEAYSDPLMCKILLKIQNEVVPEGMFLEHTPNLTRMRPGYGMREHTDDCPHCNIARYPEPDPTGVFKKRCVLYGIVVYLSDFTGGEIVYPNHNISFSPSPGDMIIHSTSKQHLHGVNPVKTGIRYSCSPYIVKYVNDADTEKASLFWHNHSCLDEA